MTSTELILSTGEVVPVRDRRGLPKEHRDPRAATRPAYWTSPTLPMAFDWDADQAYRLGYAANVIAYRCVQLRANAIASVPLVAGRRQGDYKTLNERSPILELLGPPPGHPAPRLSATRLIRWTVGQGIVTGRYAWEIDVGKGGRSGDRPVALWPLVSANVRPVPSKGGNEWFKVFHTGPHHDPVKLRPDEVFYGWDPAGHDFRQAESALQVARYDLTLVQMCDRYGIGFLRNNAVPAAIVTTTQFATEEERRRFRQSWAAELGGPENAGRVFHNELGDDGDGAVGDSIDVKVLGLSQKDARIAEQRIEAMKEIAIGLGVPWSKLDASGRTFDNADMEDVDFWENTILPDLVDLQDEINMQISPRFGDDVVWFDLRRVRALQRKVKPVTQLVNAATLATARLMKINEAREDYGLEPLDDGDRLMTFEEIAALAGTPVRPPSPDVPPPPVELPAEEADEDLDDGERLLPAAEQRVADPDEIEQRRARIWRTSDAIVRQLEARWERQWRRLFARQEEATIARLTGKRGRQMLAAALGNDDQRDGEPAPMPDPAGIFELVFWTAAAEELSGDLFDETVRQAMARLSVEFGIDFDLSAPWVDDFIRNRAQQLAGQVNQTTYDAIRQALVDGVAAGESIDAIAARVRQVFSQASETRAVTIARTEVISAYNGAAAEGAAALGGEIVAAQEWIATRDGRTRESHAAADGQVVAIGQPFNVAGHHGSYPGDPALPADETVNCRCAIAFLTPEEWVDLQGRQRPRVDTRTATAMLRLVDAGTDLIAFRRSLTEVAA